jgi:hypothetical protein
MVYYRIRLILEGKYISERVCIDCWIRSFYYFITSHSIHSIRMEYISGYIICSNPKLVSQLVSTHRIVILVFFLLPQLSRYEFIGCKSNHGGRNRPQQFETKPSVQSFNDMSIGLLDQLDACLVNTLDSVIVSSSIGNHGLSLNASLDDIKRISHRL